MTYLRFTIAIILSLGANASWIVFGFDDKNQNWTLSNSQTIKQQSELSKLLILTMTKSNTVEPEPTKNSAIATKKPLTEKVSQAQRKQIKTQPTPPKITRQAKLNQPPPPLPYPSEAIKKQQEGKVVIRATVSSSGHVVQSQVITSSGYPLLDRSALAWFNQLRFSPAYSDQGAIATTITQTVSFRLEDA